MIYSLCICFDLRTNLFGAPFVWPADDDQPRLFPEVLSYADALALAEVHRPDFLLGGPDAVVFLLGAFAFGPDLCSMQFYPDPVEPGDEVGSVDLPPRYRPPLPSS